MEELIRALAFEFAKIAPEIEATPRTSLYRIYRDTRFSKNKSPYKTHAAAVFPTRHLGKHEGAGFYFHISPDELLIGGGLYMPQPDDLRVIRLAIAENPAHFEEIVENRKFRRVFGELAGEQLARVPRGFPADHQAATYLKLKQYLAARRLSPDSACSSRLRRMLVETITAALPLIRFLNEPIRHRRKTKERNAFLLT